MGQYQKVNAQVHVLLGVHHIPIPFESDAMAEKEWNLITKMVAERKPGDFKVNIFSTGAVWFDLAHVTAVSWTKEQRVGVMGGMGMAPSGIPQKLQGRN